MSIGEPGCPDWACCTASMARVRMVLMAVCSMAARWLDTVKPVVCDMIAPLPLARPLRIDPPARRVDGALHLQRPPGAAVVLVQRRHVAEDRADDAPRLL